MFSEKHYECRCGRPDTYFRFSGPSHGVAVRVQNGMFPEFIFILFSLKSAKFSFQGLEMGKAWDGENNSIILYRGLLIISPQSILKES